MFLFCTRRRQDWRSVTNQIYIIVSTIIFYTYCTYYRIFNRETKHVWLCFATPVRLQNLFVITHKNKCAHAHERILVVLLLFLFIIVFLDSKRDQWELHALCQSKLARPATTTNFFAQVLSTLSVYVCMVNFEICTVLVVS